MVTIIAALFILISTPTFALLAEKSASPPFLYYCSNAPLPNAVDLPDVIDTEPSKLDREDGYDSTIFSARQTRTPLCRYELVLVLSTVEILDAAMDSNCSFMMKLDGTIRLLNGLDDLGVRRDTYCILETSKEELHLGLHGDIDSELGSSTVLDCPGLHVFEMVSGQIGISTREILYLTWTSICTGIDAAIILAYLLLWSNQSCYGWSIVAMVSSLLCNNAAVALFLLVHRTFSSCGMTDPTYNGLCVWTMATIQFACICSYSWTLILAFHMWTALRSLSGQAESRGFGQFLKYSAVGYGLPFCVIGIALALISSMENPTESPSCEFYAGHFDAHRYWFLFVPNGTFFLLSMVFLLLTLKWAKEAARNRKSLRRSSRLAKRRRTSLLFSLNRNARLNCKLMVLMGAFFAFQVLTAVLEELGWAESVYVSWFVFVTNILHSLCLFWTFVWNKTIRGQLATKFPGLFGSGEERYADKSPESSEAESKI